MSGETVVRRPFESLAELQTLVRRFEEASLTKAEWNHRAHLSVLAWYLLRFEESRAIERVVSGILRFNREQGIEQTRSGGYHETLTLF